MLLLAGGLAFAQNTPPRSDDPKNSQRVPGASSSKDTMIDLSAPADDAKHPGADEDDEAEAAATGVRETRPWNPHRAAKNIEVGDFYFRDKKYKSAISRYREALEYKPKDAEATFKLALALERNNQLQEAAKYYKDYLNIVNEGLRTAEVKKALERIGAKTSLPPEAERPMVVAEKLLRAKDYEAAAEAYRAILRSPEPDNDARYGLAQSLEGTGKDDQALASYFDYIRSSPGGRFSADAAAAIERLKKKGATISRSSQTLP